MLSTLARRHDEFPRHAQMIVLRLIDTLTKGKSMPAQWGVPTPSGHAYRVPTTYADARERVNDFAQGEIESWDDAERCPEPTWEVVSHLLDEIERLRMIPTMVHDDFKAASSDSMNDMFYRGAIDAADEVRRRMKDPDHG